MLSERIQRLQQLLSEARLGALALNPGPSLMYLTGLGFHLSERPTVAFFTADGAVGLVLPELEVSKAEASPLKPRLFPYGDNPATWEAAFRQVAASLDLEGMAIGVEPTRLRFLELRLLEAAAPRARFVSAQGALAALRMRKQPDEIAAMRAAVDIAQRALQAALPAVRPGISEIELAAELTLQLLRAGSGPEMPFAPIVAGGPNSANPHALPSSRKLETGDLLVIDWGAAYQDYFSDLTRTFAVGAVEPELERIVQITLEANRAAREAARPGIAAGDVDRAARQVIENAGYGAYFTHRVGHGLGMEGHEEPYMFGGSQQVLEPGMTFTIEPGIYLPGRGGTRIEDDMVITETGAESLSNLPRELAIIGT